MNESLIRSTFNSVKDTSTLLNSCEEYVKTFLMAVISNIEVQTCEQFVEEVDLYLVVCSCHNFAVFAQNG